MDGPRWKEMYLRRGWGALSTGAVTSSIGNVQLVADTSHTCAAPFCIKSEDETPTKVAGARFYELPLGNEPLPAQPSIVFTPQKTMANVQAFRRLHQHCLGQCQNNSTGATGDDAPGVGPDRAVALKCPTSASTPNLQLAVVLIAAFRPHQGQQQGQEQQGKEQQGQSAGPPAAAAGCPQPSRRNRQPGPPQPSPQQPQQPMPTASGPPPPPSMQQKQQLGEPLPPPPPPPPLVWRPGEQEQMGPPAASTPPPPQQPQGTSQLPPPSEPPRSARPLTGQPEEQRAGPSQSTPPPPRQQPGEPCFFAYFLPFSGRAGFTTAVRDRRGWEKDPAIVAWRDDRQLEPTDPATGLPLAEPRVQLRHAQWNPRTSAACRGVHAASSLPPLHASLVAPVLPGRCFHYSIRPWRYDNGILKPVNEHDLRGFLRECECTAEVCGKLRAREALTQMRQEGVSFDLVVAGVDLGGSGSPQLGVYAAQDIPPNAYVCEYVGEWLTDDEYKVRQAAYQRDGVHYLFDVRHCAEMSKAASEGTPLYTVVDATHVGNVSRFVNHRCEGANLQATNVCAGDVDETHMAIMLQAKAEGISAGDSLTLDYQLGLTTEEKDYIRGLPLADRGTVQCRCGAEKCLGVVFPLTDAIKAAKKHIASGGDPAAADAAGSSALQRGQGTGPAPTPAISASEVTRGRRSSGRSGRVSGRTPAAGTASTGFKVHTSTLRGLSRSGMSLPASGETAVGPSRCNEHQAGCDTTSEACGGGGTGQECGGTGRAGKRRWQKASAAGHHDGDMDESGDNDSHAGGEVLPQRQGSRQKRKRI